MPYLSLSPILQVTVTEEDILDGRPSCARCPIARAASREAGFRLDAASSGLFEHGSLHCLFGSSPRIIRFIRDFDTNGPAAVRPQTFTFHPIK